jgi:hypothetical protein
VLLSCTAAAPAVAAASLCIIFKHPTRTTANTPPLPMSLEGDLKYTNFDFINKEDICRFNPLEPDGTLKYSFSKKTFLETNGYNSRTASPN